MKRQTFDALSRLSTVGKDESPLEDEPPLQAIDHVVNANNSDTPKHSNDHRVVNFNNTEATTEKQVYDLPTLVKLIRA